MTLSRRTVILAVDGGGTSSRAMLCDISGSLLGYVEAGPLNYHSVGLEQATNTLSGLLQSFCCQPVCVRCAVFGLAGLDTAKDRMALSLMVQTGLASAQMQAERVIIENDGMITLAGAVGDQEGLLLIAGTGSIAWGINKDKQTVRVGGWGSRAGDEGSGFSIGMTAIRYVLRAADGRESQSAICTALLQEKGMANVENLIDWIYSPHYSPDAIAALAPVVCQCAAAGDAKAIAILNQAAQELSLMAATAIERLGIAHASLRVVLSGGVLQNNPVLCEQVMEQINASAPRATLTKPLYQPIIGGALIGLQDCGFAASDALYRLNRELRAFLT